MAKSLRCNQCNTLLQSIKEAQAHNDATGHTDFEETTVVIKILCCTSCGKPCRTDAERDLHTRYTGHTTFADKTDDAKVLNTEEQMKAAAKALKEDEEMEDADKPGTSAAADEPKELVPAEVNPELLKALEEMGFPGNRAVRAIHFSGAVDAEGAINWLVEHEGDIDIDEPLMIPKVEVKEKLTPEEARKKAEELVRRAKEKREKEERELEKTRELERIRAGKEMAILKRKEEEQAMKRILEERKREKEQDAAYKEKLRLKLEEDRKERRRKLGLPEEMTEEEKAKDAERKAQQEREENSKKLTAQIPVKPISVLEKVRAKLVTMKKDLPGREEVFKTACTTLMAYLGNIARTPDEAKFRTLKRANAAFQQRVAPVPQAIEVLELCGFEASEEVLTMPREKVNMELLNAVAGELNNALTNPFFGVL